MEVADVDDDDADEYLERDAGDEHGQHEVVEAVSLAPDVEQQLQLGDLRQRQDGDERRLRLRLRLLQLAVARQQLTTHQRPTVTLATRWLGSRVVSVLDSGADGPGFKSQPRHCRVTILGKLFTPIMPLFTKQRNRQQPSN